MSLTGAINSAVSSLLALERQMAVATNNIANAGTSGYTEESVTTEATSSGGVGTGVSTTAITNTVSQYLLRDILSAITKGSAAATTNDYYTSLEAALGGVEGGSTSSSVTSSDSDLATLLDSLETGLSSLAATPDSTSLKSDVVGEIDDVASSLRSTSAAVQSERGEADQDIASTVDDVNTQLDTIKSLNTQIQQETASGQSTANLEDERNTALQNLAGDMDISSFTDGNGNVQVYTSSGTSLLDSTNEVHSLSYSASSSMSASMTYPSGGIGGIDVGGTDITTQIKSGKIAALVSQRDTVLPAVQSELDTLASTLSETINAISNQGTADPPPNSLTGTTSVAADDAVNVASGTTIRVVLTDADGNTTATQDIDISGAATVQDIANDLENQAGVSASVVNGKLVLSNSADSTGGIAISTLSGSVGGTDLSSYFGLNDVVTGGSSAATIAVNPAMLSNPSDFPSSSLEATQTVGSVAAGASSATISTEMEDALTASQSFGASGSLGASSSSLAAYAASIITDVASKTAAASSNATATLTTLSTLQSDFSSESGVNTDDETAKLQVYQNAYAASAQVISAAKNMFDALMTAVQST
jgi:flagellar hook-associated protein 1